MDFGQKILDLKANKVKCSENHLFALLIVNKKCFVIFHMYLSLTSSVQSLKKLRLMKIERTKEGRRFTISDIHGCLKTFKALLQKIDLKEEDDLFLLGDYIDRGKDSKGVIDHIWDLKEEGFRIHCLRGNHEQMMLDAKVYKSEEPFWMRHGGTDTVKSFPNYLVGQQYYHWIMTLPYYFETEGYLLAHAGFNFRNGAPLDDINAMIWIRGWYDDLDKEWLKNRVIIHGHTPTRRPILEERLHNITEVPIVNIDCGCYYSKDGLGFLTAFDLDKQTYIFQKNVE